MNHLSAEEFYEDSLFRWNKNCLKTIGHWPYQKKTTRRVIVFYWTFILFTVVIFEVIYLVNARKDIQKIIDAIPNLIFTYGTYVMIFNSLIKFEEMKQILHEIQINWSNLRTDRESEVFTEYARESNILAIVYAGLMVSTFFAFCMVPLLPFALDIVLPLNETREVTPLLLVEYYVDPRKYYVPIYFHNFQAAVCVIFTIYVTDCYFIMITQHSCGMFAVLGLRIDEMSRHHSKIIANKFSLDEQDRIMCQWVSDCVKYHRDCLSFIERVEGSFTTSMFLQIFVNMIVISVSGVQTITRTNDFVNMIKFALTNSSVIFRLFYISWPGQKIFDHSSGVYRFLCNSNWYDFPPKAKKLLLFMILRSIRPCYITAGGMINMNFESYCDLMKTSGSYFTMILSTQ